MTWWRKLQARTRAPQTNWDDDVEDDDDSEKYRKLYNRMDAKLRRICEPKAKSGKVDADPVLVAD